jgi:predicted nucleotidyltransferase
MVNEQEIQKITQRLVKLYNPEAIYLFGSYAWGHPDEDSDLDFLIIVDKITDRYKALATGHRELSDLMVPKDLLVVTNDEFEARSQHVSQFMYKIKHNGRQIYAKA